MITWVDVKDPDGNEAKVSYGSFVKVWSDLGWELVGEPGDVEPPAHADPDEQDEYTDLFQGDDGEGVTNG